MQFDKARGIKRDNMTTFLKELKKTLNITDKELDPLFDSGVAEGKESDIVVFYLTDVAKVDSKYGYIAYALEPGTDKFAVVYAVHSLHFELAPRIETQKKRRLGGLLGRKTVTVATHPHMNAREIAAFQKTYMKFKALEAMVAKRIINQITYVE